MPVETLECESFQNRIAPYLSGTLLDAHDVDELEAHLGSCPLCRDRFSQAIEQGRRMIEANHAGSPSGALIAAIRERAQAAPDKPEKDMGSGFRWAAAIGMSLATFAAGILVGSAIIAPDRSSPVVHPAAKPVSNRAPAPVQSNLVEPWEWFAILDILSSPQEVSKVATQPTPGPQPRARTRIRRRTPLSTPRPSKPRPSTLKVYEPSGSSPKEGQK